MKIETDKLVSIAVLKARDGMGERLRDALLTLIGPTRQEPGNLDGFDPIGPDTFSRLGL